MKHRQCRTRCSEAWINRLMVLLEDEVVKLNEQFGGRYGSEHLRALAMEMWTDTGLPRLARRRCGVGAVALGAASCAVAMARMGQLHEAYLYLTMTEVHVADLMSRVACAHSTLLQTPQLWEILGYVEDEIHAASPFGFGHPCSLSFCPDGGSPNHETCRCEQLGPSSIPRLSDRICIISTDPGDDRPLEMNMAKLVAKDPHELTQFWSLTYHLNRFYARLHGYRFRRPDISNEALFEMLHDGLEPPRRVQWSIVRLIQQELEDRTCDFVVWMDSDAYIVSSEPLETVLVQNGLLNSSDPNSSRGEAPERLFFFASALSREAAKEGEFVPRVNINISDHFMVVRNTPVARRMIEEWFQLPTRPSRGLERFRHELFLEQTVMNEYFMAFPSLIAKPPPLKHFEGYAGYFARHTGGIKDQALAIALRNALLDRVTAPIKHPKPDRKSVV